jgi:hypothetical protein
MLVIILSTIVVLMFGILYTVFLYTKSLRSLLTKRNESIAALTETNLELIKVNDELKTQCLMQQVNQPESRNHD